MKLDSSQAPAQTLYQGQAYYFCSDECRRTFEQNPEEYVRQQSSQSEESTPPTTAD
jgi:Cu+-exporting ATPase